MLTALMFLAVACAAATQGTQVRLSPGLLAALKLRGAQLGIKLGRQKYRLPITSCQDELNQGHALINLEVQGEECLSSSSFEPDLLSLLLSGWSM